MRRRTVVGLAAGGLTTAALAGYAVNVSPELPGWWTVIALALALAAPRRLRSRPPRR
jgi:hypothetical protein